MPKGRTNIPKLCDTCGGDIALPRIIFQTRCDACRHCSVEGCTNKYVAKGYCGVHFSRFKKHGSTDSPEPTTKEPCSVDMCPKVSYVKGFCTTHYSRLLNTGDACSRETAICAYCSVAFKPNGSGAAKYCSVVCRKENAKRKLRKHKDGFIPHIGCDVPGCVRKHNSHGLCAMHGIRLERFGDVNRVGKWALSETGLCTYNDCAKPHVAKGYCVLHYARSRSGTLDITEMLVCAWCEVKFSRPYKGNPRSVRFCSHECRYANQLEQDKTTVRLARRREYMQGWRAQNREWLKARQRWRKATVKGVATCRVSSKDVLDLVNQYGSRCAYCKTRPYEHLDHVIPVVRGGRHSIGNLLPACAKCNLTKGAKFLSEWKYRKPVPKRFLTSLRRRRLVLDQASETA